MFLDKVKNIAANRALDRISEHIIEASPEKLAKMWLLFERVATEPEDRLEACRFRRLVEQDHPFGRWLQRIGMELNPAAKKALIKNLYGNAWFMSRRTREEFERQEGFSPPNIIVIDVTARCNLNCGGCWAARYGRDSDLPLDNIENIVSECENNMGLHFFVFSGGEPTLRTDLYDLYGSHPHSQFQIYTNGTLIDTRMAKRFAELGNVMPMLSIEGDRELTDERRGKGTYDKVMESMDRLKEQGVLFGFSATATCHNAEAIMTDDFIEKLISKGCLYGWYFQYIPVGRNPDISLMVTAEQRDFMRKRVYELRNTYPIFLADFWNDGTETSGCMAGGKRYLHVTNEGDIEPCVFCHFAADNIKNTTITEALKHPFFKAIRNAIPYDGNHLKPCMLIDRPRVLRTHLSRHTDIRPTHDGAESIVTELAEEIDEKARKWSEIADEAWHSGDAKGLYPYPEETTLFINIKEQEMAAAGE